MTQQPPAPIRSSAAPDEDEIDLRAYAYTLWESRWLIAGVTAAGLFLAVAYALLATPIYRSDTLLQVEERSGGMAGLTDVSEMLTGETPSETEIEILRSRSVVGTVVDELALDLEVTPKTFPVLGAAIARRWRSEGVRPAVLGITSYAWGGERLKVERLELPKLFEGETLELVAVGEGAYELYDPEGEKLLRGTVGTAASSGNGAVELFVSELAANSGARFEVTKKNRDETVKALQEDLAIREKGKKTGILQVSLEGPKPEKVATILDALAKAYLKQNVDRKSEEAEKTLEFLNSQLPVLKRDLEKAEQALNEYRSKKGSVDLSFEAQKLLEQVVEVEKGITELDVQRADLKQRFTESHPRLVAVRQQVSHLQNERKSLEEKLKLLPEAELNSARFMRDVKVANELYLLLLNKAQEMKVVKSGTIGNVRIVDSAIVPGKPVAPRKALTTVIGLALGIAIGASFTLIRKVLSNGVEDPNQLEQALGLPVYAVVPHSPFQEEQAKRLAGGKTNALRVLAQAEPTDMAVECLRSLRTSIQFALMDAKNRIISIGGPAPGIGKSFVSANLAQVLADGGKRVLLIDADMRKGKLHSYFGGRAAPGLSDVISGAVELENALQASETTSNIAFLPAGVTPPNPSELLLNQRFTTLMDRVAKEFELVVIDCAPILAVTDGAIVGRYAGVNLLVVKAGQHPIDEIDLAAKRYHQNGVKINGVVFNDAIADAGGARLGTYSYQYRY